MTTLEFWQRILGINTFKLSLGLGNPIGGGIELCRNVFDLLCCQTSPTIWQAANLNAAAETQPNVSSYLFFFQYC